MLLLPPIHAVRAEGRAHFKQVLSILRLKSDSDCLKGMSHANN